MSGDGGKRGRSWKSNELRIVAEPSTAIESRWLRIVVVMHGCGSMQAALGDIPEPGSHTLAFEIHDLKFEISNFEFVAGQITPPLSGNSPQPEIPHSDQRAKRPGIFCRSRAFDSVQR